MRYSASKNSVTLKTSRPLKMAPFDRSHTTFYWTAIVNIALSGTVFELCDVEWYQNMIPKYSMSRSVALSLCDSWASCFDSQSIGGHLLQLYSAKFSPGETTCRYYPSAGDDFGGFTIRHRQWALRSVLRTVVDQTFSINCRGTRYHDKKYRTKIPWYILIW